MKNYVFATNINNKNLNGIINVQKQTILCLCTEENSKIILSALQDWQDWDDRIDEIPEMTKEEIESDKKCSEYIMKHKLSPNLDFTE